MKLSVRDGERFVVITDPDTPYDAEVLADWCRRVTQLLAEQTYPAIPSGAGSQAERAEPYERDDQPGIGFGH